MHILIVFSLLRSQCHAICHTERNEALKMGKSPDVIQVELLFKHGGKVVKMLVAIQTVGKTIGNTTAGERPNNYCHKKFRMQTETKHHQINCQYQRYIPPTGRFPQLHRLPKIHKFDRARLWQVLTIYNVDEGIVEVLE